VALLVAIMPFVSLAAVLEVGGPVLLGVVGALMLTRMRRKR
jgi:hypothetical protein